MSTPPQAPAPQQPQQQRIQQAAQAETGHSHEQQEQNRLLPVQAICEGDPERRVQEEPGERRQGPASNT
ncbi:hypothetical protein PMKS-002690 [Pichia membranifaciens]|uniref:Uncharacterized protein n=1 Tax=Pichia membranifaciens TaxID=4926 RepID=A0A1Q2YI36_9ASCO|nr:hypothetical protein PMKS-002690 [Pichia membranifaciens]